MTRVLKNRVPPPVLMLAIAAAMGAAAYAVPSPAAPTLWRWGLAGTSFLAAAIFGFPAVAAFRGARTTINPVSIDQASTLVRSGIYRFSRNPMYVALTLLLGCWAAWLAHPLSILGPVAFALFIHRFQILPEERTLTAKFGTDYTAYQRSVRRWL